MVIGCAGSGKTTLSDILAKKTGLEVTYLDRLYWKPDWQETSKEEWRPMVKRLAARDSWIIDGNYTATMELRLARAQTVIFLDFPRVACVKGVLRRVREYHGRQRHDMGEGCTERLDLGFLLWVMRFNRVSRPKILYMLSEYPDLNVITLKSRKEVNEFTKELDAEQERSGAER